MILTAADDPGMAAVLASGQGDWRRLVAYGPPTFESYAIRRLGAQPGQESDTDSIEAVLRALLPHTEAPRDLTFCFWDGWGVDFETTKVGWAERQYFVFEGSLSARLPDRDGSVTPEVEPAFVWPRDEAWFLANDVDQEFLCVGSSKAITQALLSDSSLDLLEVHPW